VGDGSSSLGHQRYGRGFFKKGFVWEGILSLDLALNESTSLWWIKTGLQLVEPSTSDLGASWMIPVRAHTGKDTFLVTNTGMVSA